MSLTLDDGVTTITLPDAMEWVDEYEHDVVKQDVQKLVGGGIVISENLVTAGRPITLEGGKNVWITKSVIDSIVAMRSAVDVVITLVLPDLRSFSVMFDKSSKLDAKPVWRKNIQSNDDVYTLKIKFIEV